MKSIIILRVNTKDQESAENSLQAQAERLKKYCQTKNLEVIKELRFDQNQNKEFNEVLDSIITQPDKIVVCFDKVTQLFKNIFDKRMSALYEKALAGKIELHFISDGHIINADISTTDKFNFSVSLGLSKYYSDAISDNCKKAQEQKLRRGEFPGKAHYGYKNIDLSDGKTDIVIDEIASNIVRKSFKWYATSGFSMHLLCGKIKSEFGIKLSIGALDRILNDKFYYGIMSWNGKEYPHKYTQIIDKALFDKVQETKKGVRKI